jgi:hypothetical protein
VILFLQPQKEELGLIFDPALSPYWMPHTPQHCGSRYSCQITTLTTSKDLLLDD